MKEPRVVGGSTGTGGTASLSQSTAVLPHEKDAVESASPKTIHIRLPTDDVLHGKNASSLHKSIHTTSTHSHSHKTSSSHHNNQRYHPPSSTHVSRPVDLDEIYEHGMDDSTDDDDDDTFSSTAFVFETPEKHRISALTQTLAEKQLEISQMLCALVQKMSKMVLENHQEQYDQETSQSVAATQHDHDVVATKDSELRMEEATESTVELTETSTSFSSGDLSATHAVITEAITEPDAVVEVVSGPVDEPLQAEAASTPAAVTPMARSPSSSSCRSTKESTKASTLRAEKVRKCKQMQEQAALMANKQARIAQQFEALVFRLEQEAIDRDQTNAYLTRQLRLAQVLLKERVEQGGVGSGDGGAGFTFEADEHHSYPNVVANSNRDSSNNDSGESNLSQAGVEREVPHHQCGGTGSALDVPFTIKEISFCNTVVDVEKMRVCADEKVAAAAAAAAGAANELIMDGNDGPQPSHANHHDGGDVSTSAASAAEKTAGEYLRLIL